MSSAIEDYGIIGNSHTAALVGRDGSIDWLCLPRFNREAVFAALLGDARNGRWLIGPVERSGRSTRSYRGETGILKTRIETDSGSATIIDFMPLRESDGQIDVIRLVRGDPGKCAMHTELVMRFDYGRSIPWVRQRFGGLNAISGPNALQFTSPVPLQGTPDLTTTGEFTVTAGEVVPFTMSWYPSHRRSFACRDPLDALHLTENWWHDWSAHCVLGGRWRSAIIRSLITLKMLTYEPTGGIVAAPTTSLARADRRGPQLGLPLLLASRCDADALRFDDGRLSQRGARLARMAAPLRRRAPGRITDHVWDRRRASADRTRTRLASGLRAAAFRCASATPPIGNCSAAAPLVRTASPVDIRAECIERLKIDHAAPQDPPLCDNFTKQVAEWRATPEQDEAAAALLKHETGALAATERDRRN